MYGILGDFDGKVYVDEYSSKEFVYARVKTYSDIAGSLKTIVIVVKNKGAVPNVYGLPVNIFDGEVTSSWRFTPEF